MSWFLVILLDLGVLNASREGQFVRVWVFYVEVALAPWRVGWFSGWGKTRLNQALVECVYIVYVKNQPAPPSCGSLWIQSEV